MHFSVVDSIKQHGFLNFLYQNIYVNTTIDVSKNNFINEST